MKILPCENNHQWIIYGYEDDITCPLCAEIARRKEPDPDDLPLQIEQRLEQHRCRLVRLEALVRQKPERQRDTDQRTPLIPCEDGHPLILYSSAWGETCPVCARQTELDAERARRKEAEKAWPLAPDLARIEDGRDADPPPGLPHLTDEQQKTWRETGEVEDIRIVSDETQWLSSYGVVQCERSICASPDPLGHNWQRRIVERREADDDRHWD